MQALTPEERRAQAQKAAEARWRAKPVLKATHTGELPLGNRRFSVTSLKMERASCPSAVLTRPLGYSTGVPITAGKNCPDLWP